ncbi:unnamed protein product [Dovyalis caffra]|uniref:Uncharacterized protein n=1 Tax=Dovyalis caffra TaxID=77055 RepID=A0AAV1RTJ4_9ROSI|nr:unnamed protein product [Dovyalis caffra]
MNFGPPTSKLPELVDFWCFVDDGVPSWEKKFCTLIGSVPWRKVVDAKKYMYCHGNILDWDDSACEEAFQNAKKRFWAEMNGVSCGISPPDPNIYIDEVNWNPYIDSEVIKDLERDLFVPDEGDKGGKVGRKNKNKRNFVSIPSDGCYENTDDVKNPWESNKNMQSSVSLTDKVKSWNQWESNINTSSNLNNVDNPWERGLSQEYEAVKGKTWGVCENKSWGWNHVDKSNYSNNSSNTWKRGCQGVDSAKSKGWVNIRDSSWGFNQQESRKWNSGCNSRGKSFIQGSGASKDRRWGDNSGNSQGWKQWDNYGKDTKDLDFRKCGGDWGTRNEGSSQRESTHQHIIGYEGTRFQGDGYQTGHSWSGGRTKRRVSYAFE